MQPFHPNGHTVHDYYKRFKLNALIIEDSMKNKTEEEKQYIASISYGKDSLAMLEAIKILGLPLDRIVHAEAYATDTIPADHPEMVEFKKHADKIIRERYGIKVEHFRADDTYESVFYKKRTKGKHVGMIRGFPSKFSNRCLRYLKLAALKKCEKEASAAIQYIGIAADETERLKKQWYSEENRILPLVQIGWTEDDCYKWCEEHDLLSPSYKKQVRGGCWFCHNQRVDELRNLRKDYPDLWNLLLKWDSDNPPQFPFKMNYLTVHDFDKRFAAEDKGFVPKDRTFRWKQLDAL